MTANIGDVHDDATAIYQAETALAGILYNLSFAAEYGYGSTAEAISSFQSARRHADRAVLAAALANVIMVAKHELQAAAADSEGVRMRNQAEAYGEELIDGLRSAKEAAESAIGRARSLVELDGASPAAAVHAKIAVQVETLEAHAQRAEEIRKHLAGSRDPAELQVAADHFVALRHELEDGSGRAQEIASESLGYSHTI
jgi:hypothetical protein